MPPRPNDTAKPPLTAFGTVSDEEVQRVNRLQQDSFDELYCLFEPPLPAGVPERLEKIVEHGKIARSDSILDVGSGTGILIPIIRKYRPGRIYACDLSELVLKQLRKNYRNVKTVEADVRDLGLKDGSIDAIFLNGCYPNIVDKKGAFTNICRMMKPQGRMVISHPLGKAFIASIKGSVPFPLDEFPEELETRALFRPFGFEMETFIDEPGLYILVCTKSRVGGGERPESKR